MKILLLNEREPFDDTVFDSLDDSHTVFSYQLQTLDIDAIINAHADADVLVVSYMDLSANILSKFPSLKAIIATTTAIEYIDTSYASAHDIQVLNTAGYTESAVAEHLLALMLAAARRMPEISNYCKSGDFKQFDKLGFELYGKTLGILGMGNIGQRFLSLCDGFSLNCQYYNRTEKNVGIPRVTLEMLLETSDIIAITLPLNEHTQCLIDQKAINLLKDKSILVSISPDGIFNMDDLVSAVHQKKFFGLGLDLHHPAPQLYSFDNVVVTPTKAWLTKECLDRRTHTWFNVLCSFLKSSNTQ